MAVDIGAGNSTLTFNLIVIGNVITINVPTVTRDAIDITDLSVADMTRTFIPGLIDPGEITFDGYYDPALVTIEELTTNLALTSSASKAWSIKVSGSDTFAGNGFVTSFGPSLTLDGPFTYSATIKVTGAVTPPNPT